MVNKLRLDVHSSGLELTAGINDVPLVTAGGATLSVSLAIDEWIAGGPNHLTMMLDWPAHADYEPGLATLDVSVRVDETDLEPLAHFVWPDPRGQEGYPYSAKLEFTSPCSPATHVWEEADTLNTAEAGESRLLTPVKALHEAVCAREVAQILQLLDYKHREMARAYDVDPAIETESARRFFEDLFSSPEFAPEPFDAGGITVAAVARKKMLWVRRLVGEECISIGLADDYIFHIPIYLARISGEYVIAR